MNFMCLLLFYFAVRFHVQFPFQLALQCFLTSKITYANSAARLVEYLLSLA